MKFRSSTKASPGSKTTDIFVEDDALHGAKVTFSRRDNSMSEHRAAALTI